MSWERTNLSAHAYLDSTEVEKESIKDNDELFRLVNRFVSGHKYFHRLDQEIRNYEEQLSDNVVGLMWHYLGPNFPSPERLLENKQRTGLIIDLLDLYGDLQLALVKVNWARIDNIAFRNRLRLMLIALLDVLSECVKRMQFGQRFAENSYRMYALEESVRQLDFHIQRMAAENLGTGLELPSSEFVVNIYRGLEEEVLSRFPSLLRIDRSQAPGKNILPSLASSKPGYPEAGFNTTGETLVNTLAFVSPSSVPVVSPNIQQFLAHRSWLAGTATKEPLPEISLYKQFRRGEHYDLSEGEKVPFAHVRVLGHGGFGVVEEVRSIMTSEVFARKTIKNEIDESLAEVREKFLNEVKIIQRLSNHRHIVKVFASYTIGRELSVLIEPVADGGDLHSFLRGIQDAESPHALLSIHETILTKAVGCLLSGLAYMHKYNIRHKDIKPKNILIHQGSVLFTDFGASFDSSLLSGSTTDGQPGPMTRRYCAPEVADWESRNAASDVFSLGCIFIEILRTLEPKYSQTLKVAGEYHREIETIISYLRSTPFRWPRFPLTMILPIMLRRDPVERGTSGSVLNSLRVNLGLSSGFTTFMCKGCLHDAQASIRIVASSASHDTAQNLEEPIPPILSSPPPLNGKPFVEYLSRSVVPTHLRARALFAFHDSLGNFLGVSKGDSLEVVRKYKDREWMLCYKEGMHYQELFFVPEAFLEIEKDALAEMSHFEYN
ncbi:MAG: hypothetical protein M1824_005140 [Vezdaea acicularis]|nr:MAG: hypothetical protein M1824_005140 [Vezdaea acicularis]